MLPIAFASPLMLFALAALPALWLLLRLIPPRPRRIAFPPLKLMLDLAPTDETPARTPWWLTLLRLTIAALVILMLAGPVWNPPPGQAAGSGPILMLVDNGWSAARDFETRRRVIGDALAEATASGRPVALVPLADPPADLSLEAAAIAAERLRAVVPRPWTADRGGHLAGIGAFLERHPEAEVVWFADGTAVGRDEFIDRLRGTLGERRAGVVIDGRGPLALAGADNAPAALSVRVLRATDAAPATGLVRALDLKSLPLGDAPFAFAGEALETTARFDLPVEIRNDIARLEIVGEASAGAVQLIDDRWQRRTVGIASGQTVDQAQPLLSAVYYLSRALEPFADLRPAEGASPAEAIDGFVAARLPVIILADVGTLGASADKLADWVETGGVLIRFAGPRLAAVTDETLLPVRLRQGDRTLGGALSWEAPQPLGPFAEGSPFAGLAPPADVSVTRQVLAEPDGDLSQRVWASLGDGTPLVTAARRGEGLVVLFHVSADARWSNLPLSGTFVEMLRRVVALSGKAASAEAEASAGGAVAAPSRTLDGEGRFEAPPPTAEPVRADAPGPGGPRHPPGFYGTQEALVAVNALAPDAVLSRLDVAAVASSVSAYAVAEPRDLKAPLIILAAALLMLDTLIVFLIGGGLARLRRRAAVAGLALLALAPPGGDVALAQDEAFAPALRTHLAYVITGDAETDETSRAGLFGLTEFIALRTALEPGEPIGIDLARDELAFHALLYWPIVPGADPPPPEVLRKVDTFMKSGGTILFDTRDALDRSAGFTASPAGETLRELLASFDIPALEVVPPNHVLTKTFYLMSSFPGRYESGDLWVEAQPVEGEDADRPALAGDGVSPIIITSNDLAAAWAVAPDLTPLYPLTPDSPRQREMAFRGGVNLVMYALTGNYKSDQVHVPALLERLGQ